MGYKRNYSLNMKLFLLVDDITNVSLSEAEKPYIELITANFGEIIDDIANPRKKSGMNIKFERMIRNFYRRIMVKIINPDYVKKLDPDNPAHALIKEESRLLKDKNISFEYYSTVTKF